ncbi:hypothetical protein [Modestobacter sp. VKM Ac-2978]|uniref:hypothetical protein n=1 Tax=Modestobacter sp. VKM Ac-2978 TaxID=3004132 RepID=UPI0022AAF348|nr:hypothetical protein [Modestobacter sp. VKM Ac-2978]MCZ2849350.1 hypothetical protein [Modestobacter sp. VKM Ac-2978]
MTAVVVPRRTGRQLVAHLARRAIAMEIGVWQSLHRFLFRRPRVPAGAVAFTYHRAVLPLIVTFIVLSVLELVVVDLVVHRWPVVRVPLLVLGIWGVTWMLGFLAALVTRPHSVGPDGIHARYSTDVDVALPWSAITAVTRRLDTRAEKAPRLTRDAAGAVTLHLWMQDRTNVDVELDQPVSVRLPEGTTTVHRIGLFADDPAAFLAAVRQHC